MVKIGIAGTNRGAGVTHYAISLASTLKKNKCRVAVMEMNDHDDFIGLGTEVGAIKDEDFDGDYFSYRGIDFFIKPEKMANIMFALNQSGVEYLICDYGTDFCDDYFKCDSVVLVMSSAPWVRSRDDVFEICEKVDDTIGLNNVNIILPFADKERKNAIETFAKKSNVIDTEYDTDCFDATVDYTYIPKATETSNRRVNKLEKALQEKEERAKRAEREAEEKKAELKRKEKEIKAKDEEIKQHKSFFDRFKKESEEDKRKALAEAERRAEEEKRRIEEEARLEQERLAREEEEKRRRLEEQKEAEKRRIAEEAEAERLRIEEEKRIAEENRRKAEEIAEAERQRAEEERLRAEEEKAHADEKARREREIAEREAEERHRESEAEAKRLAEEAERKAEAERLKAEEEKQRAEAERQKALELEEKRRQALEEYNRLSEEAKQIEEEKQRAEELARQKAEEAERQRLEAEEHKRLAEEAQQRLDIEKAKYEAEQLRLMQEKESAEWLATHDPMTEVGNRAGYNKYIDIVSKGSYRIIFFDVNNLKKVNDGLGHEYGDDLIKTVSQRLSEDFEHIFRVGGDEFIAVCEPSADTDTKLLAIDEYLAKKSENNIFVYQVAYGYADYTEADTPEEVSKMADERMYLNKKKKKGETVYTINYDDSEDYSDYIDEEIISEEEMEEYTEGYECIPGTSMETDELKETLYKKPLSTMWRYRVKVSYEFMGRFDMRDFYVFPTEYQTAPKTVNSIVAVDVGNDYEISYGTTHNIEVGNAQFICSARFMKDGSFNITLLEGNSNTGIKEKSIDRLDEESGITPRFFGKHIVTQNGTEIEVFPIKENYDGNCDCVIKQDDELYLSNGLETGILDTPVSFIFNGDDFEVVKG